MVAITESVNLSNPVKGVPVAKVAYVLYEQNGGVCAATRHPVEKGRLKLGRVIALNTMSRELAAQEPRGSVTLLPPSVVVSSASLVAWTSRKRLGEMWFHVGGKHTAFRVFWPDLIWLADRQKRGLRVFALGSARRPTLDTRLYHAPLMNIGQAGHLCEGSATLPTTLDVAAIPAIEACLFESCFTHVNHQHTIKGGADNKRHLAFWRGKSRQRTPVRVKELMQYKRLGEVLND